MKGRTEIYVFGAGGHSRVVVDAIERQGLYQVAGCLEAGSDETWLRSAIRSGVVAIGDNGRRAQVAESILRKCPEFQFVTVIHPSAQIGSGVEFEGGCVVMAGSVVQPGSRLGAHCLVNTMASVDHDCTLARYSSIGPGAVLGGGVQVGEYSAVSLGACVLHGIRIGSHTVVGAGALVTRDLSGGIVAYGTPARKVRGREPEDRYL